MFFRSLFFFLFILFFSPLLFTLSGCSCSSEVITEDKEPEDKKTEDKEPEDKKEKDNPAKVEYYSFSNKIPYGTTITLSPTEAFSNYINIDFSNDIKFYLSPLSTPSSSVELPSINTNSGLITLSSTTSAGVYSIHITNNTTSENISDIYLYITQSPSIKTELENLIQEGTDNWGETANLNYLETSAITDMSSLFENSDFKGDISDWDVSSVTTMQSMFSQDSFNEDNFNGDISDWDVSSVTTMQSMFYNSVFKGDISDWDVSSVTTMQSMFHQNGINDDNFKGDISDWDVSSVTNMQSMFYNSLFNGDISDWDVSSVTTMVQMFKGSGFKGDISDWDVNSVTTMQSMFTGSGFNGDISDWDVSSVTTMQSMFAAADFNGDISDWDVSSVTTMVQMFFFADNFSIDLEEWKEHWVLDTNGKYTGNKDNMFDSSGVTTPPSWY